MSAPIGHTCPHIDGIINELRSVAGTLDWFDQHFDASGSTDDIIGHVEDLAAGDLKYQLECQEGVLEDLRTSNSILRDWGEELEAELEDSETKVGEIEDQIYDLEQSVEAKDGRINELEAELLTYLDLVAD